MGKCEFYPNALVEESLEVMLKGENCLVIGHKDLL